MVASHPYFDQPADPECSLWRYMDLSKFVNLLQSSEIFFARADALGDPFEGSLPIANVRHTEKLIARGEAWEGLTHEQFKQALEDITFARKQGLKEIFVSCWHAANYESAAMWTLYAKSGDAVAIRTSYARLVDELPTWILMGKVRYIDYEDTLIDNGNLLAPFIYKRNSFEHEKEVRALIWMHDAEKIEGEQQKSVIFSQGNVRVKVNLQKLLTHIYVSPSAPKWFADLVEQLVQDYKLDIPVTQSNIAQAPVY